MPSGRFNAKNPQTRIILYYKYLLFLGPRPLAALKKKRRRLPVLERPKSAPLSGELLSAGMIIN